MIISIVAQLKQKGSNCATFETFYKIFMFVKSILEMKK